ncbi:ATPase [Streptomyces sulfonofaciens]|uniref:ATPase n=1 Tax=Streptomyces sulfonofaciens TaxID=68272 RepID=A0A919GEC9_9ACTN|nr:ATP-binding protein [Streptomyces sulfonofaciens]GHH82409.1 ATPase [Streptomyces sulfonofaciens]
MTAVDAPVQVGDDREPLTGAPGECLVLSCDFSLPTDPVSVSASRAIAGQTLDAWGFARGDALRETALLVLSELVTNSVRHAAALSPQVDIGLSLTDGELTVAVHDRHPHRPVPLPGPRADGDGGWGLRLVSDLAAGTGGAMAVRADRDGPGKTVAARLALGA